jgi:hypothetical protein
MSRYIFYDKENLHDHGFEGIEHLSENDVLIIFYSDKVKSLLITTYLMLKQTRAEVRFIKTTSEGQNALDFQLTCLLGAYIEKHKHGEFYILSKDKGFRFTLNFCKEYLHYEGMLFEQKTSIKEIIYSDKISSINRLKEA